MSEEQRSRRSRLAAELGDACRDVRIQVRVRVEHPGDPRQVLGEARNVGADEHRRRVLRHEGLEGPDDPVEWWERARVAEVPVGIREQLLQPLVRLIERPEEGNGVGDVDRHGDAEPGRRLPERSEAAVVGHHHVTPIVTDPQTELLPDLQPARTREHAAFKLRRESIAEPGLLGDGPVQLTEREEPVRMGRVVSLEVLPELVALQPIQVHDGGDVARVHDVEQLRDIGRGPSVVGRQPPPEMVVGVDDGEPGPGHVVGGKAQGRTRPELAEREVTQCRIHAATRYEVPSGRRTPPDVICLTCSEGHGYRRVAAERRSV